MKPRLLVLSGVLTAVTVLPVLAQAPAVTAKPKTAAAAKTPATSWTPAKTPWGDPDLQGTWTSDDTWGVPVERPPQYGDRRYLTEQELADRAKRVEQAQERLQNPGENHSPAKAQLDAAAKGEAPPAPAAGAFGRGVDAAPVPGHWGEFARRASKQTSQAVDPPNGRIPPLTPEAQKKLAVVNVARRRNPETWEDQSFYDRCITRGVVGSIMPVVYGNGNEIVQAPGYVAIRYEMVHDTRIIPLDGRPRTNIRSYMGEPRGHWEGNTLVVETTNFLPDRTGMGPNGNGVPTSEDLRLVERFTRVSPNTIDYEVTITDPKTYTAPWTLAFPITHEEGYQLFEYACHEGNMSMRNMLSATRAEEKAAEEAAKKK
jgi:hypothetical protein